MDEVCIDQMLKEHSVWFAFRRNIQPSLQYNSLALSGLNLDVRVAELLLTSGIKFSESVESCFSLGHFS
jgi:hypothetical protein